jgi:AcrR family transcriptional regulator
MPTIVGGVSGIRVSGAVVRSGGDARARMLDALVELVCERGYGNVSVGLVVARARTSRRTFYEQFDDLRECLEAVLDLGLTLPSELIVRAFVGEQDWRDGVRAALAELLVFFDSEPLLTRVWFGEVLAVGSWALEHRERNIAAVSALVVAHWFPDGSGQVDEVLVRGVMTSVLGALTTHVVTRCPEPMAMLLVPLTRLVMAPFLDEEAVQGEVVRAEELTREILAAGRLSPLGSEGEGVAPGVELPGMLANPTARRARECVLYLAQHPGASNNEVGVGVGISHEGQISRLLARLAGSGLLDKRAGGPGRPNAWTLTPEGERVAHTIEKYK